MTLVVIYNIVRQKTVKLTVVIFFGFALVMASVITTHYKNKLRRDTRISVNRRGLMKHRCHILDDPVMVNMLLKLWTVWGKLHGLLWVKKRGALLAPPKVSV